MAALTLSSLRDQIRTQIHGRRVGLDNSKDEITAFGNNGAPRGGFLVGHVGQRLMIQKQTSTTPTTFYPSGYIELGATTGSTITLLAPVAGSEVTITQTATSTLGMQVVSSGAFFNSSTGSSANSMSFWSQGATVRLVALSSALWSVCGVGFTTAQVSFSSV